MCKVNLQIGSKLTVLGKEQEKMEKMGNNRRSGLRTKNHRSTSNVYFVHKAWHIYPFAMHRRIISLLKTNSQFSTYAIIWFVIKRDT
jgi:hypothetical protein